MIPRPHCTALAMAMAALASACGPTSPPTSPVDTLDAPGDDEPKERPFSEEERAQSRGKLGGIWTSCYQSFQPDPDPGAALARLTNACGRPTGMAAITPVRVADVQSDRDAVQRFSFHARANKCYRVYAVGGVEVVDLDVALLDPRGKLAGSDSTAGRWPVVPARGPLCAAREGAYTLEVSIGRGSGAYALQVWGD